MKFEHASNTEVSITLSDEEALQLANLLNCVNGTGSHCGTAVGIFFGLRSIGIIGGKHKDVFGNLQCY